MGTAVALNRIVPPRPTPGMVPRARLDELLDAAMGQPLTVVTGPPARARRPLMSSWLRARDQPGTTAWLAVDRTDTRPAQFWAAAIDAILAAGERGLNALKPGESLGGDEFVPAFANAVSRLKAPLVLILDDFQELRALGVSEQLDALLRHPPDNLRIALVQPRRPALLASSSAARGTLSELRAADLAFTFEEAADLFELAGLELTADQLRALHERTEGWVAGLRLAALSLQACEDADELIRTFAGDERTVADYLVEEVLQRQPDEVRDFMLRTSVVDLINPDLADALTRRGDGGRILEAARALQRVRVLRRRAGRLVPLPRDVPGAARSQLRHRMPEAIAVQHRHAARWYAKSGAQRARPRSMRCRQATGSSRPTLLSGAWLQLLVRGEAHDVADLFETFPRRLSRASPSSRSPRQVLCSSAASSSRDSSTCASPTTTHRR